MFKKKHVEQTVQEIDDTLEISRLYTASTYENDFKFLFELITFNVNVQVSTGLAFINVQLKNGHIDNNDSVEAQETINFNILNQIINTPYEKFIVKKYFGTTEKLYTFIADKVAYEINNKCMSLNYERQVKKKTEQNIQAVNELNKKPNQNN